MSTPNDMLSLLKINGKSINSFQKGDIIHVNNKMVKNYSYTLSENPGTNLGFKPYATPEEMLCAGVFEGKYLNDCLSEFPKEWFIKAIALGKLSPQKADVTVNAFQTDSRLPLQQWQKNAWVPSRGHKSKSSERYNGILSDAKENPDERGWFQWYCRYWLGRRIPALDKVQIGRWRSFARHAGSVKSHCSPGEITCSVRERQALLQWAYNPFM